MAKQIKIKDKLGKDLEKDLPQLASMISDDLLAYTWEAESLAVRSVGYAIKGYNEAKLTEKDTEDLEKINADLLESAGSWDRKRSKLIVSDAANVAKLAAKFAKDPVKLTEAITVGHANQAIKLGKISADQAEAEADLASDKSAITDKQSLAGVAAFLAELKYTEGSTPTGSNSRFKVGESDLLVVDLLKTRPYYSLFHVTPDRSIQIYPISSDWEKHPTAKIKLVGDKDKINGWHDLDCKLIDHKDSRTPTGVQSWAWGYTDRAGESKDLDTNAERMNVITENGNLKAIGPEGSSGNTGGSANVFRIVDVIDPEGGPRQITWKEAEEKYYLTKPEAEAEDQPTEAEAEK